MNKSKGTNNLHFLWSLNITQGPRSASFSQCISLRNPRLSKQRRRCFMHGFISLKEPPLHDGKPNKGYASRLTRKNNSQNRATIIQKKTVAVILGVWTLSLMCPEMHEDRVSPQIYAVAGFRGIKSSCGRGWAESVIDFMIDGPSLAVSSRMFEVQVAPDSRSRSAEVHLCHW